MEQNDNYFNDKSEAEKLRNISNLVNDIVNAKPEEPLEVQSEDAEPEENLMVELVGKALSAGKPKGFFMQGVQTDDNTKL